MILERAQEWMDNPYFDPTTREIVKHMILSPAELKSAFFTELKFGTGGLRGIMGVGTARLNIYTIRKATQGVAHYLIKQGLFKQGVVIGYDSRHCSELFAHETARIFLGNQIPVFLCRELRTTPFISFACRYFQAAAGIMITASHNPKEYNGYKVYGADGAQIVTPHDIEILQEIEKIESYSDVKVGELTDACLTWLDKSADEAYLQAVASHPLFSPPFKNDLKICYSSLHGAGIALVPQALQACGFSPPLLVSNQCQIDGDFPSVSSPNPESTEALQEGMDLLKKSKSDILFVTDPDADRLGVVVTHKGQAVILSGHALAVLGTYYICDTLSKNNLLLPRSGIITTVVTTPFIDRIAAAYNVKVTRVLTGFKYIGEKIGEWEKSGFHFLFGAEESYGYLMGSYCRDKDGISSAALFARIAAHLKEKKKSLVDLLHELYRHFGVFQEKALSLAFAPGQEGMEIISYLMQELRQNPPATLGDQTIIQTVDYLAKMGELPSTDMLQWLLEDGTSIMIRPSGTEPKLKAYLSTYRPPSTRDQVKIAMEECQTALDNLSHLLNTNFEEILSKKELLF